jgi:hypothetical protein
MLHIGGRRGAYRVLVGKSEGKRGVDGRIILKLIFKGLDGGA